MFIVLQYMPYVSFVNNGGRTGNNIFQYLAAKLIQIKYGHVYVPFNDIPEGITITDAEYDKDLSCYHNSNIICKGYFQKSEFFVPYYRQKLIDAIKDCDDCWFDDSGNKVMIRDFFLTSHTENLEDNDVVVSLRLDDFIQHPCPTSDILPPQHYLNILENVMQKGGRLIIVSDKLRWDWEHKYVEFFQKWNPIFYQENLLSDFALMRDCPTLLHSNSTFCWLASFFSQRTDKRRYIPNTHFYVGQSLNQITETDIMYDVTPLHHADVYALDIRPYLNGHIFPLPYCIPDECVMLENHDLYYNKTYGICPLIPGERSEHLFVAGQESEYYQMFQQSWFAHTKKKGGWDCLRHYEILANGCIPMFENLEDCPEHTLTTFPKQLLKDFCMDYDIDRINLIKQLLEHTREHCTTSANIRYFLSKINISGSEADGNRPLRGLYPCGNLSKSQLRSDFSLKTPKNVLLIVGNKGVNYTREFFWIGMKRYLQSIGGIAVEYPKIDYLYEGYPTEQKSELHGNGFTYSGRLLADEYDYNGPNLSSQVAKLPQEIEEEITEKIKEKFFDLIVYGKVGPDEGHEGSLSGFPLWEHVFPRYSRDEIVCLYGGDECIDLTSDNDYRRHIYLIAQYATCFVRELRI